MDHPSSFIPNDEDLRTCREHRAAEGLPDVSSLAIKCQSECEVADSCPLAIQDREEVRADMIYDQERDRRCGL